MSYLVESNEMQLKVWSLCLAVILVAVIDVRAQTFSETEVSQASQVIENLFRGTIELSQMPQDSRRWDLHYELFKDHLRLTHPRHGKVVFKETWQQTSPSDQEYFYRVSAIFITEAFLVRKVASSVSDLGTGLTQYADYLGLNKDEISKWASNPASIPIRIEPIGRSRQDSEAVFRFRILALPDLVDRVRRKELPLGDSQLKKMIFYAKMERGENAGQFILADLYQPEAHLLNDDPITPTSLSMAIGLFVNPGGQYRAVIKRNEQFAAEKTGELQVRIFSDWLWTEYLKRFTNK